MGGRWTGESRDRAVDKKWSDRDLEDAKISVFQGVDAPKSVNQEGMGYFLHGITEGMRQKRREQLLDVTKDQVREVAQKFIVEGLEKQAERLVFLGEKRDWVDQSWSVKEMDTNGSE